MEKSEALCYNTISIGVSQADAGMIFLYILLKQYKSNREGIITVTSVCQHFLRNIVCSCSFFLRFLKKAVIWDIVDGS